MALDLTLIPIESATKHERVESHVDDWGYGHTVLEIGSAEDLEAALAHLPRTAAPKYFLYHRTVAVLALPLAIRDLCFIGLDGNGQPLQCLTARVLVLYLACPEGTNRWRRAAAAYLNALDPDTRVVLFWH